MKPVPTLYGAIEALLGPLAAEYGRLIDEGKPDAPVVIQIYGYKHKTTLKVLQDLDRAHQAAFDAKQARAARRAKGTLL